MDFKATSEFAFVQQEYQRFKNDMLLRGSEDIYNNALTIFLIEQAFSALSNHMDDGECIPLAIAAIAACEASGNGFLARLAEWAIDTGDIDFSDAHQSIISIMFFAQAVSTGEWKLSHPREAEAVKFPAKVLDSHLMVPCASYQKVAGTLRGFTLSATFKGVICTLATVAFADIHSTTINELDAELRAAAQDIACGYIKVLGLLGPWYWIFHDGKVEVDYGACALPPF